MPYNEHKYNDHNRYPPSYSQQTNTSSKHPVTNEDLVLRTTGRTIVIPITLSLTPASADNTVVTAAHVVGVGRVHDKVVAIAIESSAIIILAILASVGSMSGVVPDANGVTRPAVAAVRVSGRPACAHRETAGEPFVCCCGGCPADGVRDTFGLTDAATVCCAAVDVFLYKNTIRQWQHR